MSRLSDFRSKLRASGTILPRSIAINLLGRLLAAQSGAALRGLDRGEPGIKKYRAYRKMRRRMADASRRRNREKK